MSITLLNAASSTGTGVHCSLGEPRANHTVAVTITGAPSAVTIDLEGSLDGVNWVQLQTHTFDAGELSDEKGMFHSVNTLVNHVRANLTTLTGGTSPTVTAKHISS
nr:hypothetical protein 10 [Gammaproteobacteria bacterium]